ncbi:hypothetical protein EIP86_005731 [Pleurotus ostreatoroseus]|nr:hypothetical protein EIP86_005731 [Pleurotus ostreatoroseus]
MGIGEIVGVAAVLCFLTWWTWSNLRPQSNQRATPETFRETIQPSRHDARQPATYVASTQNYALLSTPSTQPPRPISRNFVQTSSPAASAVQVQRPPETPRRTAHQPNEEPTPSSHGYNLRLRDPKPVVPRVDESPWDDWDESNESGSDTEPVNDELDSGDNDSDYAPSTASLSSTLSRSLSWSIPSIPRWTGSLFPMTFTGRLKPYQDEDARTLMQHESEVNARWNAGQLPGQLGYILAYMMGYV